MRQMSLTVFMGAFALLLTLSTIVGADQVYHSERLPLTLTDAGLLAGHPELRSGQVVNIHPNGPVNGALERYMINGALPNTSYQVVLQVFNSTSCDGETALLLPTAIPETNKQGNAQGQAKFSRQALDPFSGLVFGIRWTLVDPDGVVAYQTRCTVVTID
jgi:hypothetical protein